MLEKSLITETAIAEFSKVPSVLQGTRWLFVVKSQNQKERRKTMLSLRGKDGRFGRLSSRPTAVGLLVSGVLQDGVFQVEWTKEFREPRHIVRLAHNRFLLTEINRLLWINERGEVLDSLSHPLFGFLHSINLHSSGKKVLVTSTGYDSVFELDLDKKIETFRWCAWEHGFNPDEDGNWLAISEESYAKFSGEGKKALLIRASDYGEQGIMTARRSAHPNVAVYDPYDQERSMIVCIGHAGNLYRISLVDGSTRQVADFLSSMPHGLFRYVQGWVITNTTKGEWLEMTPSFSPKNRYRFAELPGKPPECGEAEWIQQVIPVGETHALALDANRGLITIDLQSRSYSIYQPDENWCIQDAHQIGG